MAANVFTYGTLTIPEVMEVVSGASYRYVPATAKGYSCTMLRGKRYPAIFESSSDVTDGVLFLDVTEGSLERIDYFEDNVYQRQDIAVETDNGTMSAWCYVLPGDSKQLLEKTPWDAATFRQLHLEDYLANAVNYMKRFD